jgi:protoporphyrinogen oxidase
MGSKHKVKFGKGRVMKENIVIIGAGISGLSTAYFLKKKSVVLEAKPQAGGLCFSFVEDSICGKFIFDCSGHFLHIKDDKIKNIVAKLTGGLETISRNTSIYFQNKFIPFPFQANLFYLDEKTKKDCINGILKRKDIQISNQLPFLDWSKAMFGSGITKHFMQPYNEKLWSYDLKKMNASWTGAFVPKPDAQQIIKSATVKNKTQYGYNSVFYYPKRGGCGQLINGLLKKVNPNLNEKTLAIDIKNKTVTTTKDKYLYSSLISTQPLPELINQINNAPQKIKIAAAKLKCSSVRCINLGIKGKLPKILKDKHWIYIPQKDLPFYRVGIYSNVNSSCAPKNSYSFYVEFSSANNFYKGSDEVIKDLHKMGFIGTDDEIVAANIIDMPYAYVIFDSHTQAALKTINDFLLASDIYPLGRYGAWQYSFIEKNIKDAVDLANHLNKTK